MQVPEEGMPIYRQPFTKGCLFVKFEVEFPTDLVMTPENSAALSQILKQSCGETVTETDDMDVCELEDLNEDAARERERTRSSYEPEEEQEGMGGMGGQAVQCQQS